MTLGDRRNYGKGKTGECLRVTVRLYDTSDIDFIKHLGRNSSCGDAMLACLKIAKDVIDIPGNKRLDQMLATWRAPMEDTTMREDEREASRERLAMKSGPMRMRKLRFTEDEVASLKAISQHKKTTKAQRYNLYKLGWIKHDGHTHALTELGLETMRIYGDLIK